MTRGEQIAILSFGIAISSMLTLGITVHVLTKKVEARNTQITEGLERSAQDRQQSEKELYATAEKVIDAWKTRAEKCEVKERFSTVVYEYRPSGSIPVLHGAFSITPGSEQNHPDSDLKPVWVIPVQTPVYTNMQGVSYEWIDNKTVRSIGRFPATPPPMDAPQ